MVTIKHNHYLGIIDEVLQNAKREGMTQLYAEDSVLTGRTIKYLAPWYFPNSPMYKVAIITVWSCCTVCKMSLKNSSARHLHHNKFSAYST